VLAQSGGVVKTAIVMSLLGVMREEAERQLEEKGGVIRRIVNREPPPVL
jgi:N-acetylmuramic acid 6-phosphate (MurNAc-6-P) etherase